MGYLYCNPNNPNRKGDNHWVWRGDKKRPMVLGHRGVPRAAQENTIAALEAAKNLGIDGVEIDVMVTKDNVVVLFHDEDTERLTGTKGCIADMTYNEVSKLRIPKVIDATGTGKMVEFESEQEIPTLEFVLNTFQDLKINIEVKAFAPTLSRRHWGTEVAKVIRDCNAADRVIVTSFDFLMLKTLEKEFPGLESGLTYDDGFAASLAEDSKQWFEESNGDLGEPFEPAANGTGFIHWLMENVLVEKAVGSTVAVLERTVIDKDTIQKFHERGHAVGVYCFYPFDVSFGQKEFTEEEEERLIRRLVQQGADWFETDDPEKMMALLHKITAEDYDK